jgi:Ca-activated chloride channel family protein
MIGVEQSIAMREAGKPARIFLLSDGAANVGLTDPSAIAADCTRMAGHGITTSTCGLGMGFNEELMAEMAQAGQGNAYYGETAEDLQDPFEQEFDLLRNICARGLRLRLSAGAGVELRVLNQYTEEDGDVLLPDLAVHGEAWALVEMRFDESDEQLNDRLLLSAEVSGETTDGDAISDGPALLRLPRLPASAFEMITQDEIVQARARELRSADLQERARLAARRHDWDQVEALIDEAQRESGENAWVAESLGTLRELAARREMEGFSKEAMYSSRAMRTRLGIATSEDERIWNAETESAKPSYLRRKLAQGKRMQTGNKRQD